MCGDLRCGILCGLAASQENAVPPSQKLLRYRKDRRVETEFATKRIQAVFDDPSPGNRASERCEPLRELTQAINTIARHRNRVTASAFVGWPRHLALSITRFISKHSAKCQDLL